ncbi:MAG TPA: YfiR family protein [Vicinamibacterales bacterium]|nr:YfiR family protein [Vicinamibacterales bacterium]
MAVLGNHLAGAVAVLAAAGLLCAPAGAAQVHEHDVKAAFLFNFTRFVEWPAGRPEATEPFRLCVLADDVTAKAVERTMKGESVQGHPARIVVPQSAQEARFCQILFVGRSEMDRAAPLLSAVRDLPVLTVGDADRFVAGGGTIQFVLDQGRVRFDVNLESAKRAGLTISSRLLRVARHIGGQAQ